MRSRRAVQVLLLGLGVGAVAVTLMVTGADVAVGTPDPVTVTSSAESEPLDQRKLEEEVRKLRLENDRAESALGWLLAIGPFATVVVAVLTLAATYYKQSRDLAAARASADEQAQQWAATAVQQQQALLLQQQKDVDERERERLRRFDEHLATAATNIGSPSAALRMNAAATLGLFIKPNQKDLHPDLLNLVVANLKIGPDPAVGDLLRRHLAKLLHLLFAPEVPPDPDLGERIDLTRVDLSGIDVHELDTGTVILDVYRSTLIRANLRGTRMVGLYGGKAVLDGARFPNADLTEARLGEATALAEPVDFQGARLVSAFLGQAKLPRAKFQGASLQGARFQDADLRGALFVDADLADARFVGATLDEQAKRSIVTARRWRQAFFSDGVKDELERLSRTLGG